MSPGFVVVRRGLSRSERRAEGKARRDRVSRGSHASWTPPPSRPDPVETIIASGHGRLTRLLPIRYERMMQSPFAYFRGVAGVMAADLASTPASGIRVQACGDCHLLNFSAFATPERHLIFGINDFDETLPAPWEWDLKRLTASIVIGTRHQGASRAVARANAERCAAHYREHMAAYSDMTVLNRWYDQIYLEDLLPQLSKRRREQMRDDIDRESSRHVMRDDFPQLASNTTGQPRIKDNPPLIFHLEDEDMAKYREIIVASFRKYRGTLADDRRALVDMYEIRDMAVKVVGIGSVGTRCLVLLLTAGRDDALFLQVKEARASVLEPFAGRSPYVNHGQRVVAGQRLMQSASDLFLGWTEERGRHYYVRQLRDMRIKTSIDGFSAGDMTTYAEWCGRALARSHAKAGDAAMISGYLGSSPVFDQAIGKFASEYADQNDKDYAAFSKAYRGRGRARFHNL